MKRSELARLTVNDQAFRTRLLDAGRLRVQRHRLYVCDHNDQWVHVATHKPIITPGKTT